MGTKLTRRIPPIFTIGHSNRSIGDFIRLLQSHGIKRVIDIRTVPKSRHNPQFTREALCASLQAERIGYTHLKKLGGLRHSRPDSKNLAWRNTSFRGFADYMQMPEFELGLERAMKLASTKPCALMCAEAVPWRCHRSLVSDALIARGLSVEHIISGARPRTHKITPFARVRGTTVTYPSPPASRPSTRKTTKARR